MMDAQQIYDNFHSQAQGTGGLAAAQEAAQQLAGSSQDRAAAIQQVMSGVRAGWQGTAAEAAAQGMAPYSVNALSTDQRLAVGQAVIERQMNSFQTAASEVVPVPPAPQSQDIVGALMSGQDTTPLYQQVDVHYAAQAVNVDAYNKYVGASQDNTASMPTIIPVDSPGGSVSVVPPSPTSASSAAATHLEGRGPTRLNTSPSGGASGVVGVGGQSAPISPASSSTTPSSGGPTPVTSPGQNPPVGPEPGVPGTPMSPVVPIGPVTGVTPGGTGSVPTETGTGVASQRPGQAGPEPEAGPVGIVGVFEPEPWSGSDGGMLRGQQPVSSGGAGGDAEVGPRTGVDAEVASRRGLLGPGSSNARGSDLAEAGPVGSGRRGFSDEDDEYTNRYLEEEDGNELFGATGAIAPAVIGESVLERAQRHGAGRQKPLRC